MRKRIKSQICLFLLMATLASGCSSAFPPAPSQIPPASRTVSPTLAALPEFTPTITEKTMQFQVPSQEPHETASPADLQINPVIPTSASEPTRVSGTYLFSEGPASDGQGNVFFSDINAGRIYKWSPDGKVVVFKEELNAPNGLVFLSDGSLAVCEGGNGRLIAINARGNTTILADQYNHQRFNEPNDLWVDPQGGIYFTDPAFNSPVVQGGEHVYYISADRKQVTRVINDMVKPNGITGTRDGKTLLVSDYGAGKTYSYKIQSDGSLTDKQIFAAVGSDGMKLDSSGNLYVTTPNHVQVFGAGGSQLLSIATHENPTNIVFIGKDEKTLFITARSEVYTVQIQASANSVSGQNNDPAGASTFKLTSPDVTDGGNLPMEYTCDGKRASLPLNWSSAPTGTKSYAIIMHHVASPTDIHWYWVMYDIPPDVTSLVKNSSGVGLLGINSVNKKNEYTPPCSKGPGPKMYTYTVYALSEDPSFSVPATGINRDVLLEAIQNITLDSAELHVSYSRK